VSKTAALIEVRDIGKSFGATRALDQVSVEFLPGEIMAMVGANGAGKSTLIKIICGYYADYEGSILVEGKEVKFTSPKEASDNGIATVHQIINQGVVQNMAVYENLTLAELLRPGQSVFYNKEHLKKRAREVASTMGLKINLDAMVVDLTQSERQEIAIARALASNPRLLILDEPTSSLSEKETERLFATLERLKGTGVSILYVSHRLHEISRLADRVTVIRDGKLAGSLKKPFLVKEMVTAMVGELPKPRDKGAIRRVERRGAPQLAIKDLVVDPGKPPVSFTIGKGEIIGLTGLIGAGKSELAQVLFGMRIPVSGEIVLDGKQYLSLSISDAVKQGVFYVPEDRSNNAVVPLFNLRQNMTLPFLRFFSRMGIMRVRYEQLKAQEMIHSMGIKCDGEDADIDSLSGGNQQKTIVARWLLEPYKLLILDEPFQGVDIKSRHDMAEYIRKNIGDKAALIIATDLDEVMEVADRILVLNNGALVGEQDNSGLNRDLLLHWISQEHEAPGMEERYE